MLPARYHSVGLLNYPGYVGVGLTVPAGQAFSPRYGSYVVSGIPCRAGRIICLLLLFLATIP